MSNTQGLLIEAYSAAISTPPTPANLPVDASTKAHHRPDGKGFQNPWDSWNESGIFTIGAGVIKHRYQHGAPDTGHSSVKVIKPVFPSSRSTKDTQLRATWLGHACYYVEFPGGLRALFDPVFSDRCSPVQFMGPKRYTKAPCAIADIPEVDIVCISHSHYDHLDHGSICQLRKSHPKATYFVPLGNKQWFTSMGVKECVELDWWDQREVELTGKKAGERVEATVTLLPCQHTSGRGLTDRAATLWGSWGVRSGKKNVYFAGDTGYRAVPEESNGKDDYSPEYSSLPVCPAFKQIGKHQGPFDLGLIPIGAYDPRWIMSSMHANPMDAVNIMIDTKCQKALGMHWGTWVLTDEDVNEPPKKLREALKVKGIEEEGVFDVLDIGGSWEY